MNFEGDEISEIKEMAKYLGLRVSGRRKELIKRINEKLNEKKKVEK